LGVIFIFRPLEINFERLISHSICNKFARFSSAQKPLQNLSAQVIVKYFYSNCLFIRGRSSESEEVAAIFVIGRKIFLMGHCQCVYLDASLGSL
jgi:hypothetical protein